MERRIWPSPALLALAVAFALLTPLTATADEKRAQQEAPKADPAPEPARPAIDAEKRTGLNLLGHTDTSSGESQRNENVQFNPIDNNALKELNVRLGTTATIVPQFQIDRSYFGSEFGRAPSASPHLAWSRTNGTHGNLYLRHTNNVFNARSFFQVGDVKPSRVNDLGFRLMTLLSQTTVLTLDGGEQRTRGNVNGNVLVPRADERTPLTNDPLVRPIVARFLAAYPADLPNRTDINERALNTNSPQSLNTHTAGMRLDHQHNIGRISGDFRFTGQNVKAFQLVAGQNPDSDTKSHAARLTWTRDWSPSTLFFVSTGFDRLHTVIVPEKNAVGPQVSIGAAFETLGPGSNIPIDRAQNLFVYAAQVAHQAGVHSWKFGIDMLRRQINGSEYSSQRGVLSFVNDFGRDAITNFRLGTPSRFSVGVGDPHRGFRDWEGQFYVGDNWRVLANLTLNYGVQYAFVTRPSEVNGLSTLPYGCQCANIAPRFGFSQRLPGPWGVLRGAYGLHYGEIFPVTFQQVRFNPPGVIKVEILNPYLGDPLAGITFDPNTRSTVFVLPQDMRTPRAHEYNFSWESSWSSRWSLQLGYVGSRSDRLLYMAYNNRARVVGGIPQTSATVNLRRPDATRFDVRTVTNGSRGYFDATRAAIRLRSWRGWNADIAYWFGKAIDLGGNYTNPASNTDTGQTRSQSESLIREDLKGLSSFDQPHGFLTRVTYETPRHLAGSSRWGRLFTAWSISIVGLVKSGTPFSVISGSDSPGFGNVDGSNGDRPNLLDPQVLGRTIGDPDTSAQLLPRSAFGFIRPTDARGTLGNHVFRKGSIRNVNASASRPFRFWKDRKLTFNAESINLLNTPQFAEPSKELTSPSFGQITNTLNDGRTFRFQFRFDF